MTRFEEAVYAAILLLLLVLVGYLLRGGLRLASHGIENLRDRYTDRGRQRLEFLMCLVLVKLGDKFDSSLPLDVLEKIMPFSPEKLRETIRRAHPGMLEIEHRETGEHVLAGPIAFAQMDGVPWRDCLPKGDYVWFSKNLSDSAIALRRMKDAQSMKSMPAA